MKIVVVGGGAGGLELATKLGKKLGRKQKADIVLVDKKHIHLWKPLLHEVASGTLDSEVDAVSYRAHAHNYSFRFKIGTLTGIDSQRKVIMLSGEFDDDGAEILPPRDESYDLLVMAVGSESSDFGIQGVSEYCTYLDSLSQAKRFQTKLLNHFISLNQRLDSDPQANLSIAIVGGGATGVELSAELVNAQQCAAMYGLNNIDHDHFDITLIEAGTRILPALNQQIADSVLRELEKLDVKVLTNTMIEQVRPNTLITSNAEQINADLMVWAAGIKAPEFLRTMEFLQFNKANQILIEPTLQAKGADDIFVIGDCAGLKDASGQWIPPRAQSAHQMAAIAYSNILNVINKKPLQEFKYKDHGSLVSLSRFGVIGRLMGNFSKSALNIEGKLARLAYISLYRMHQITLHGWIRMLLIALSDRINKVIRPRLKLH